MWGLLSNIGGGLNTLGRGIGGGINKIPRLTDRLFGGGDPAAMARTPDFVPPVRGGMSSMPLDGGSLGQGSLPTFMKDAATAAPDVRSSAAPTLPMRNIGAGNILTDMAREANPPLEQAPKYVDPIRQHRDEFVNDRLSGRARWKQMAIPALLGAASQGESGNLGQMLGGALGGLGMGAFAPKQALEGEYEMRQGGRDREELGREQDWQKAQETFRTARERNEIARRRAESDALIKTQEQERLAREAAQKQKQWEADQERQKNMPRPINAPAYVQGNELKQNPFYPQRQSGSVRPLPENVPGYLDPSGGYQPNPGYRPKTERETGPPSAATQQAAKVDTMRSKAMAAWDEAKSLPDSDPEKPKALANARSAMAQYNEAVKQLGTNYGDFYETGTGDKNWGYYKPRKGQRAASSGGNGGGSAPNLSQYRDRGSLMNLLNR